MIQKSTLDNGVRVLVEPIDSVRSAAIGLTCRTGSRHELVGEEGLSHFIEHMLFKGTETRTSKQIAEEIEGRGGILNAFTDKEQTTYYCRVLGDDVGHSIEVLADMMTGSLFDPVELEREKGVVLEEIKRSEDEPGDHVHELHIESRWGDHVLGKPIIGTRETVSSFGRDHIIRYLNRRYLGGNVVLSVAGYADPSEVERVAQAVLGGLPGGHDDPKPPAPASEIKQFEVRKDIEQVHFCIGSDSVGIYDDRLYAMGVLDSILGGGMSSRLFQEVREKRGLVYAIGSYNLSYTAGGLFTIYGGTGPETWDEVQEVVRAELGKFIKEGCEDGELEKIKRQMSGHMVMALEGMNSRMMRMTKNELNHGREIPLDETLAKIERVSERDLQTLAEEFLTPEKLSTTVIRPE